MSKAFTIQLLIRRCLATWEEKEQGSSGQERKSVYFQCVGCDSSRSSKEDGEKDFAKVCHKYGHRLLADSHGKKPQTQTHLILNAAPACIR